MPEPSTRKAALTQLAKKSERENVISQGATLVLLPFSCAIVGVFTPQIYAAFGGYATVGVWVFLLAMWWLYCWRWQIGISASFALLAENDELKASLKQAKDREENLQLSINLLAFQANYALAARGAIFVHTIEKFSSRHDLSRAIANIVSPLSYEAEFLFEIGPSEKWSFAVYLYSKAGDTLVPVWRDRARSHPSPGTSLGREWGRGEGHVGKAFVDRCPIITGDATDPEAAPFSTVPPGKAVPHDGVYVSFASIPIGPILNDDSYPYGVLVGTSDRAGRFHKDNAGILVQIAGALASLITLEDIDIDKLVLEEPERGGRGSDI